MSGKELLEGMTYVEDRLVEEAEVKKLPGKKVILWKRVLPVAACLCILIAGTITIWDRLPFHAGNTDTTGDQESLQENLVAGDGSVEGSTETPEEQLPSADTGEVPSIILHIDALSEDGFTGTVSELVDTDIFDLGTELTVIVTEDATHEISTEDGYLSQDSAESKRSYEVGSLVMVQFISYDEETKTIVVNQIRFLD